MIARLYEDAAETVAGFSTEDEYQAEAAEAFAAEQGLRDLDLSCRFDGAVS